MKLLQHFTVRLDSNGWSFRRSSFIERLSVSYIWLCKNFFLFFVAFAYKLQEILIDHELKTVSYIADIGEIFVLMARRPDPATDKVGSGSESKTPKSDLKSSKPEAGQKPREPSTKLVCHVLESREARLVAQAVGHAFQLAYLDFLRENGIEDLSSVKHLNYEEVLNQQEIFCDELTMFSDKDRHKQITIPKQRGEQLGVVIVGSGWGSLLPTALLANMNPTGPAARCGQLNIGNHIISVNGQSLVGLPLSNCQHIIKVGKLFRTCPDTIRIFSARQPVVLYMYILSGGFRPFSTSLLGFWTAGCHIHRAEMQTLKVKGTVIISVSYPHSELCIMSSHFNCCVLPR
ncbi:unnamed protein product [Echinostoma caproni]|uniref:PDZ domain-containing protein n=1 Tax=Echinostoma caproni TaxID=27848 RepID=A0A3P8L359_9TREM|nr:unnamed protein product [Echinostoma caproni]